MADRKEIRREFKSPNFLEMALWTRFLHRGSGEELPIFAYRNELK